VPSAWQERLARKVEDLDENLRFVLDDITSPELAQESFHDETTEDYNHDADAESDDLAELEGRKRNSPSFRCPLCAKTLQTCTHKTAVHHIRSGSCILLWSDLARKLTEHDPPLIDPCKQFLLSASRSPVIANLDISQY